MTPIDFLFYRKRSNVKHWKNSRKISEILYDNVWVFGDLICKLGTFMTMINFYGSTIFLMAISVDRFLAIVYPLKVSSEIPYIFIEYYKNDVIYLVWYCIWYTVYHIHLRSEYEVDHDLYTVYDISENWFRLDSTRYRLNTLPLI